MEPLLSVLPSNVALGTVEIGPSRILRLWIALSTTVACLLLLGFLPRWIVLLACSSVLPCAWQAWRLHAARSHPQAVTALHLERGVLMRLRTANGWTDCQLGPGTFVSPSLTLLNCQAGDKRSRVVLTPDSVQPDQFRQLRVVLAWGQVSGADPAT